MGPKGPTYPPSPLGPEPYTLHTHTVGTVIKTGKTTKFMIAIASLFSKVSILLFQKAHSGLKSLSYTVIRDARSDHTVVQYICQAKIYSDYFISLNPITAGALNN